jgi:hypothetical protein
MADVLVSVTGADSKFVQRIVDFLFYLHVRQGYRLTLTWARWILRTTSHPTPLISVVILFSYLQHPLKYSNKKCVLISSRSHVCYMSRLLILLELMILILVKSVNYVAPYEILSRLPLLPFFYVQLFSSPLSTYYTESEIPLRLKDCISHPCKTKGKLQLCYCCVACIRNR